MSKYIIILSALLIVLLLGCTKEKQFNQGGIHPDNIQQPTEKQTNDEDLTQTESNYDTIDGIKIKEALIDYMQKSEDKIFEKLIVDVSTSKPYEFMREENKYIQIGSWQYSYDDNSLNYMVPVEGYGGLWFKADITKKDNSWVIQDISTIEIFR